MGGGGRPLARRRQMRGKAPPRMPIECLFLFYIHVKICYNRHIAVSLYGTSKDHGNKR